MAKTTKEAEKVPERAVDAVPTCPHYRRETDGIHVNMVDRCHHPDCEKWFQKGA
jgi:hypothetical protein